MKTGLVVGKFAPLHKGHELLINAASRNCDQLVIICYSNPALGFSIHWKKLWLTELFPDAKVIIPAGPVPHNDASDVEHRDFCAELCEKNHVRADMVFSSEDYGLGFAKHLSKRWNKNVGHIMIDAARLVVPISGTVLRADKSRWAEFVHPFVISNHTKKLLIVGGESAGKTTLARRLSEDLALAWVPEYGRLHCESIGGVKNLTLNDMQMIGRVQANMETSIQNNSPNQWVICDTGPITTRFYSEELFGSCDAELLKYAERKYDMIVLLGMDQGWQQDGDRFSPLFSKKQEQWYRDHFNATGQPFIFVEGPLADRVEKLKTLLGGEK